MPSAIAGDIDLVSVGCQRRLIQAEPLAKQLGIPEYHEELERGGRGRATSGLGGELYMRGGCSACLDSDGAALLPRMVFRVNIGQVHRRQKWFINRCVLSFCLLSVCLLFVLPMKLLLYLGTSHSLKKCGLCSARCVE